MCLGDEGQSVESEKITHVKMGTTPLRKKREKEKEKEKETKKKAYSKAGISFTQSYTGVNNIMLPQPYVNLLNVNSCSK